MKLLSAMAFALFAASAVSCYDPVHSDAVDALGPEVPGFPEGPTHRAGQPCLTCHGGKGPGSPEMAIGGTVFAVRGGTLGQPGVTVTLVDAVGSVVSRTTNQVGNFYIFKSEWEPKYPLSATISDDTSFKVMNTRIGGNGSCAECHRGTGNAGFMPGVYLGEQ